MTFGTPASAWGEFPAVGIYENAVGGSPVAVLLLNQRVKAVVGQPVVIDPAAIDGLPA